jgi:arylsulfatase A-like enzyme
MIAQKSICRLIGTGSLFFQASGQGAAEAPQRPNVVLILSDQQRKDTCGVYGSPVTRRDGSSPTPFIDQLASEGVRFNHAYCNSPLCAPSRASLLTGTYPHTTTAIYHQPDRRSPGVTRFPGVREGLMTMGEVFRGVGYRTAAIGKMHVHGELKGEWDMGFDVTKLRFYTEFPGSHYGDLRDGDVNARYRGSYNYKEKTYQEVDPERFADAPEGLTVHENNLNPHYLETLVEKEEEMFDHMVAAESIRFIEESVAQKKPFFIHVGMEKPHPRWDTFQRFLDLFDPTEMPLPDTIREWKEKGMLPTHMAWIHNGMSDELTRNAIAGYYACVADLDEQVGRILTRCSELGIDDNTIFVFTSDHGEMLFDHGIRGKHNMYEASVAVPLILKYKDIFKPGTAVDDPVGLIDVFPTLTELCGIERPASLEGVPLQSVIAGEAESVPVFSEFHERGYMGWPDRYAPVRMAVTERFKYVYTHGVIDQLFDRINDPGETVNLATDPAYDEVRAHLKLQTLESWELDSYPQLDIQASVKEGRVDLTWESASPDADYTIYRSKSPDISAAGPIAKNLSETAFADTTAQIGGSYSYWVLANIPLTQPFTDRFGKKRYGNRPVLTAEYPHLIPATGRLDLHAVPGKTAEKNYEPWNGGTFEGIEWIWTGYPLVAEDGTATCFGSSFILAQDRVDGVSSFSAMIQTVEPGKKVWERGGLVFNHTDCDHYYRVTLKSDGQLALEKVNGFLKPIKMLHETPKAVANSKKWNRIGVSVHGAEITVHCNGEEIFTFSDPEPLRIGRPGFVVMPGMTCRFKEVQLKE